MNDNRDLSQAVANLVREHLEQGMNPAEVAGILHGIAHAVLDEEFDVQEAMVRGAQAFNAAMAET